MKEQLIKSLLERKGKTNLKLIVKDFNENVDSQLIYEFTHVGGGEVEVTQEQRTSEGNNNCSLGTGPFETYVSAIVNAIVRNVQIVNVITADEVVTAKVNTQE